MELTNIGNYYRAESSLFDFLFGFNGRHPVKGSFIIRGESFLGLDIENHAVSFPRPLIVHYDMT